MLYLIFTEGYAATSGPDLHRPDLAAEAIRLAETTHDLLPDDSEVTGLLALMLLTDARAPARATENGELVQAQQPQTLAHALADSPVGLLGWNAQAMHEHGLDTDTILTHVTIHWLTGTAGPAIRIYAEEGREEPSVGPTTVPLGVAQFPNDLPSIRGLIRTRPHEHRLLEPLRPGRALCRPRRARPSGRRHPPVLRSAPLGRAPVATARCTPAGRGRWGRRPCATATSSNAIR